MKHIRKESRLKAFQSLGYGYVPESVLRFSVYGFEKLEKELHIDNIGFLYNILTNIESVDKTYLGLSKTLMDLLQQSILEADDSLDHLPKTDEEILASESIKAVNTALFTHAIIKQVNRRPENISRFTRAVNFYLKSVGELFATPVECVKNKENYFRVADKEIEYKTLADTQILRGSHLRIYFSTVYLVDPQPSDKNLEKIAQLIERSRGIDLLIKDILDLDEDKKYGNYNLLDLITTKYGGDSNLTSIIRDDLMSVAEILFDDMARRRHDLDTKYSKAADHICSVTKKSIEDLEHCLEESRYADSGSMKSRIYAGEDNSERKI